MATNTWHAQRTCCCTECREELLTNANYSSFKTLRKTLVKLLLFIYHHRYSQRSIFGTSHGSREFNIFLEACCCFHNIKSCAHFLFTHFSIFAESPDTLNVLFNLLSSSLDPPRVKLTYAVQKNETKCLKGMLM